MDNQPQTTDDFGHFPPLPYMFNNEGLCFVFCVPQFSLENKLICIMLLLLWGYCQRKHSNYHKTFQLVYFPTYFQLSPDASNLYITESKIDYPLKVSFLLYNSEKQIITYFNSSRPE